MHFLPTSDQVDLQRGVRALLDARFTLEQLPHGYDASLWSALTETGVFSLRSELELGLVEASLVFEELGRACVPGPLVGTFLSGGAVEGPVTVCEPGGIPLVASHLDIASAVLVLDDSPRLVPGVTGAAVPNPLDPLTPLFELTDVPSDPHTAIARSAERLRLDGALLTAAIQVGLAARLTELAVDYAKQREQFGKVIGSFQAIKHQLADVYVANAFAKPVVSRAAWSVSQDSLTRWRDASHAKYAAGRAAQGAARTALQVHAGIGYTFEHDLHMFMKRTWSLTSLWGGQAWHRTRVADAVLDEA
jgi:alkylation response protein AidB-like acyl-CoA dehydrogenase